MAGWAILPLVRGHTHAPFECLASDGAIARQLPGRTLHSKQKGKFRQQTVPTFACSSDVCEARQCVGWWRQQCSESVLARTTLETEAHGQVPIAPTLLVAPFGGTDYTFVSAYQFSWIRGACGKRKAEGPSEVSDHVWVPLRILTARLFGTVIDTRSVPLSDIRMGGNRDQRHQGHERGRPHCRSLALAVFVACTSGVQALNAPVAGHAQFNAADHSLRVLSGSPVPCSPGQVNTTTLSVPAGWECTDCFDGHSCPEHGSMVPCLLPNQYASHGSDNTWGPCSNVSAGFSVVPAFVNGLDVGISVT